MKKVNSKQKSQPAKSENIFTKYCSEDWAPLIKLNEKIYQFKTGERIFNEGDKLTGIFYINSGRIKVVAQFQRDQEKVLRLASNGSLLGHRGFSSETYPVSAIALTDTSVTFLPTDVFIKLLRTNPDLSMFFLDFISSDLRASEERMVNVIHHDVRQRIADIICMLIETFGYDKIEKQKLSFTLSRKDIANIAGTTYETVIRTLFYLNKTGLIGLKGKAIVIKNEKELRKFAGRLHSKKN